MSTKDANPDAISAYLATLKWYVRLDYYLLSDGERKLLRAMCSYSPADQEKNLLPGRAVFTHIKKLAERAGMTERSAQRLLHGYRKGTEDKKGLKARGIVSETAPANSRKRKAATYRVNWDAFIIDPKKLGMLEERMQLALPGMKRPSAPDADLTVQPTPGDTVSPDWCHRVTPPVTPCRGTGDTVSPVVEMLIDDRSVSATSTSGDMPVEIQDGLRQILGSLDDRAIRQLWLACRHNAPDCTVEEVLHFAWLKAPALERAQNPAGLLIHAVPQCFAGAMLADFRRRRQSAAARVMESEQQAALQAEQLRAEEEERQRDLAALDQLPAEDFRALHLQGEQSLAEYRGRMPAAELEKVVRLAMVRLRKNSANGGSA